VPEVRDEAQLGRGHGVVSREGHVELEHTTFVHGVLGTLEIDAPVVEVGIVRDFGSKALHRIRHKFCCKQHRAKRSNQLMRENKASIDARTKKAPARLYVLLNCCCRSLAAAASDILAWGERKREVRFLLGE
jgi:hypothetical protein